MPFVVALLIGVSVGITDAVVEIAVLVTLDLLEGEGNVLAPVALWLSEPETEDDTSLDRAVSVVVVGAEENVESAPRVGNAESLFTWRTVMRRRSVATGLAEVVKTTPKQRSSCEILILTLCCCVDRSMSSSCVTMPWNK